MDKIINDEGNKMQEIVCIEEMSELAKELTKHMRGKGNRNNIIEETSHVLICIRQIMKIFNIDVNDIQYEINKKTDEVNKKLSAGVKL